MHRSLLLSIALALLYVFYGFFLPLYSQKRSPLVPHSLTIPQSLHDPINILHLTDVHVSTSRSGPQRYLDAFLTSMYPHLHPHSIILTGDIVEAYGPSHNPQILQEWQTYKNILSSHDLFSPEKVLEVLGNHCLLGTNTNKPFNPWLNYSITSLRKDHESFKQVLSYSNGLSYSFIGINQMNLDQGPVHGLDFFTHMTSSQVRKLKNLVVSDNADLLIGFGHYPSNFVLNTKFSRLVQNFDLFLTGHLHTSSKVFTNEHLEVMTADFAHSHVFRLVLIDNLIVTTKRIVFTTKKNIFPIVVISNLPEPSLMVNVPRNACEVFQSIRIMIFDPLIDGDVEISGIVDDFYHLNSFSRNGNNNNLFEIEFPLVSFCSGMHRIILSVTTESGSKEIIQNFSFDTPSYPSRNFWSIVQVIPWGFNIMLIYFYSILFISFALFDLIRFIAVNSIPNSNKFKYIICFLINVFIFGFWFGSGSEFGILLSFGTLSRSGFNFNSVLVLLSSFNLLGIGILFRLEIICIRLKFIQLPGKSIMKDILVSLSFGISGIVFVSVFNNLLH
ncbi:hypothetical protein P9112_009115 [Eukaryota sp. TZLM1-RC]